MAENDVETYKDVADLIGSTDKTLSAILQQRQMPTVQHGITICEEYGFSANWLFLGKGQKLISEQATLEKIFNRLQKR